MSMDRYIRSKMTFFIILLLVIIGLIALSFYFVFNSYFNKDNTSELKVYYGNGSNEIFALGYSASKEEGNKLAPKNDVTIYNNGLDDVEVTVSLTVENALRDNLNTIYCSINGEAPKLLSELNDYIVLRQDVAGWESVDLTVQIWSSENTFAFDNITGSLIKFKIYGK